MLRGDVFALRPPRDARGGEQRGRRYAVVLQADALAALSTVIVAPTSTRALPASFHPTVTVEGTRTHLLVEQLAAVDPGRLGHRCGRIEHDELMAVDDALRLVLGLVP